jgi:hypothetical protein
MWEGICEGKPIKITCEQQENLDVQIDIEVLQEGFLTDLVGGAVRFTKAHPIMTTIAIAPWARLAYDAVKKYKLAKQTALKFYAPNQTKRAEYFKMVREIERTGQYKIVKQGYRDTGYYWELHRR